MARTRIPICSIPMERPIPAKRRLCLWTHSAIVLLDTFVTLYFFFAGPLCFWAIVLLDTVVTITLWTTCDSNPDDRLGMGTSILGNH
ncbi:hypothetical protein L210DRAFT_3517278 [Boletus edulis BED1]|uniref:Uncharacterized protein n=1 Tax=Boletus edulis BED1 TaxID=1328754 RepID=A0AAD4C861_BOLED|nr:hypothetical protein L210DRAFT_3517278 [Boletus edulis BED1]